MASKKLTKAQTAALIAKGRTPAGTKHEPTQRRSISGRLVDLAPAKPWWLASEERAEASKVTGCRIPTQPLPEPVFLCECRQPVNDGEICILTQSEEHMSTEFRGYNRTERRKRGERGGYAKGLHLRLGASLFA